MGKHKSSSGLKKAKYERHPTIAEANKRRREEKRKRRKQYWAQNEDYQKRQIERRAKIEAYKPGTKFHLKTENEAKDKEAKEQRKKRKILSR